MKILKIQRVVSAMLALSMTAQPAWATTYQYNVHVKGFKGPTTAPGTGVGAIDPGADDSTGPSGGGGGKPPVPRLSLAPSAVGFDSQEGEGPSTKHVLVTNVGTAPAVISGIQSDANFQIGSNCPDSLAPNAGCVIETTFEQKGQGAVTYDMALNVPGALTQTSLHLYSTTPEVKQAHPRLKAISDVVDMGDLNPGEEKQASAYLVNVGDMAAQLSGLDSSGDFAISHDCPSVLEPQAVCTITAQFSSFLPGNHTQTLSLTGEKDGAPVPLTFTANVLSNPAISPKLAFDKPVLDFGELAPNASATLKAVLSNQGTAPAMLNPFESPANFAVTSDCPDVLPINGTCQITAVYTAKISAAESLVTTAQNKASARLLLKGTTSSTTGSTTGHSAITLDPSNLDYSFVDVGQTAVRKTTVTNTGDTAVALDSIAVGLGGSDFSQTNDCPASLQPGGSCAISVTFKPSDTANKIGTVAIKGGQGLPTWVTMVGVGRSAQLSAGPSSIRYGTVKRSDGPQSKQLVLSNTGNTALTGLAWSGSNSQVSVSADTCTETLAPKESCSLNVVYQPGAYGEIAGTVTVNSANGGSFVGTLTGLVIDLATDPSAVAFPDTRVGQTSAAQFITLTNTGTATIPFEGLGVWTGITDFNQSNNCGSSLGGGASCKVAVAFTPAAQGTRTGSFGVVSGGTVIATVGLSGPGSAPDLLVSTDSVLFPGTNVGSTSPVIDFVVRNPTSMAVGIKGMGISTNTAEFSQSNNCGTQIPSGSSCVISVQATPASTKGSSGTWALESELGMKAVSLQVLGTESTPGFGGSDTAGTGPDGDGFVHYSIRFPNTEFGASSPVRNVTFSNSGTGPLTVKSILPVSGQADFTETNDCGSVIAPGKSCTITLQFSPSQGGARTGGVAVISDNGKFFLDLSGSATAAAGTITGQADFGVVAVGQNSDHTFYLQNSGSAIARNVRATLTGTDLSLVSNTCGDVGGPVTLAVGSSCSMVVRYAPSAVGVVTGASLKIAGTFPVSPTLALSGQSPAPVAAFGAAPSNNFGGIAVGGTKSQTYSLSNTGQVALTLDAQPVVGGDGFTRTGGTCLAGTTLALGASCTVSVSVQVSAIGPMTGSVTATVARGAPAMLALSADGVDPADLSTVLLLHMDGSYKDSSPAANTVAVAGAVSVSSSPRFGSGSLITGNTSSGLVVTGANFAFPAGTDFTIEAFIYPTGTETYKQILGQWGTTNAYQFSLFSGQIGWQTPADGTILGRAVSYNAWHHVAVSRAGTTLRLFVDGVQVSSTVDTRSYPYNTSLGLGVGKVAPQNGYSFGGGAIDEVRVSRGYARYTGNFTPPVAAFTK